MSGNKVKKKCCGKFKKKGKHCSSCPIVGDKDSCKQDKEYCDACDFKSGKKKKKAKKAKNKKK